MEQDTSSETLYAHCFEKKQNTHGYPFLHLVPRVQQKVICLSVE